MSSLPEAFKSFIEHVVNKYPQIDQDKITYCFCGSVALNLFLLSGNYHSSNEEIKIKPRPKLIRKIGDLDYIVLIKEKNPRIRIQINELNELEKMIIKYGDNTILKPDKAFTDELELGYVSLDRRNYYIFNIKEIIAEKAITTITSHKKKHDEDISRIWDVIWEIFNNEKEFENYLLKRIVEIERTYYKENSLIKPYIEEIMLKYPTDLVNKENKLAFIKALNNTSYPNVLVDLVSQIKLDSSSERLLFRLAERKDFNDLANIILKQENKKLTIKTLYDIKSSNRNFKDAVLSLLAESKLDDYLISLLGFYSVWGDIPTWNLDYNFKNKIKNCLDDEDEGGFSRIKDPIQFFETIRSIF